mgnify:CR=1 FL=1
MKNKLKIDEKTHQQKHSQKQQKTQKKNTRKLKKKLMMLKSSMCIKHCKNQYKMNVLFLRVDAEGRHQTLQKNT